MPSTSSNRVSSSRLSKSTTWSVDSICRKVLIEASSDPHKTTNRLLDIQILREALEDHLVDHWIIDDCLLLVYAVGKPWYSRHLCVEEQLVLKFTDGPAVLKDAVDLMLDISDEFDCKAILAGGAFSNRPAALTRAYKMLGFQDQSYPELIMWR